MMGELYARSVLRIPRPRVGFSRWAKKKARATTSPARHAAGQQAACEFHRNVEGRDIYNGNCDVMVCDGFVGNVALKTSEGLAGWCARC